MHKQQSYQRQEACLAVIITNPGTNVGNLEPTGGAAVGVGTYGSVHNP